MPPSPFFAERKRARGVAVVLGLALAFGARAEEAARPLRFQHLGLDEGLSHSRTHALLRDKRGFLWIGTEDGLNRYDGSFVVYRASLQDAHALASSQVRALFEDAQERLWIGAGGTLHRYDRARDRFVRYPLRGGGADSGLVVRVIRADASGRIWVGTRRDGLFRVDPANGSALQFRHDPGRPESVSHDNVVALVLDRRGRLWAGTRRGLNRYDEKAGGFVRYFQDDAAPSWLKQVNIESMIEDEHGILWLGTIGDGLVRFDPETGATTRYVPSRDGANGIGGSRILSLGSDGKGRLFLGPEDAGLDVFEPATGRFTHHRPDPEDGASLSSSSVTQLYFDAQGIVWVGTFNGGVDYVSAFGERFGLVRARAGGLTNPHVLALMEDRTGALWIGTDGGGLVRWDRRAGGFTAYRHDPARADSLASNAVLALHEDALGAIWIGTWGAGLDRLDPRSGRFRHYRNKAATTDSVWTISPDGAGKLLLGTFDKGAQEFAPETGQFQPFAGRYAGLKGSEDVRAVAHDARGNLWLSDPGGALYVDRAAGTAARVTLPLGAPQAFLIDSRQNVWIGTDSGGLYRVQPGGAVLGRYTIEDGLPSDHVSAVLEDESGDLWIGTSRGIARVKDGVRAPTRPQVLRFDVRDGLQGSEFKRGAAFRSRDGELFFGGQRGFNYFFPKHAQINPHRPAVVFTGLQLFNQPVAVGRAPLADATITEAASLELSHRDSVVTFEFAALDFVHAAKNQYKYKLEGFDAGWNQVGGRRSATYTNLPPGRYSLRVAGSNNDGVWNEEGARLAIVVRPPFWRTWIFESLVAAALLATALGAHRWRVARHLRAERILEARVKDAIAEIKTLSGLLPMCAWCKKIREDDGSWREFEVYVRDRTRAEFTHGICPDCRESVRHGRPSSRPSA